MLVILKSLNAHSLPIFQPILMIPVSKFMVHRALSDKTYLSSGLLSPLMNWLGFRPEHGKLSQLSPGLWKYPTWSHFIQDKLEISILVIRQEYMNKEK